ncbi:efflux pump antibiotic resistance protein, putative [Cordyceps militaris CM01]|uniref:Efflux pump antibiotic resistance protein, putative n=1 Tax=Cordyceps militaris (strain CM01) TaxID=983644 RepID=G3J540_CORMM|nr:efflux pump antibiotic resistance protein, putative [Cordyceps militaris CM01]EGX95954.1 efflux pump antibiotic resistance protein, putative [Cordyceps militaris CM01]
MAAAQIDNHLAIAAPEKESIDPKDGVSPSETLVSDPSAPREPVLEKAAKPPSPRPVHGAKWVLVVVSLLASFLLYALDTTIVATIQPAIVDAFGHVDLVPWLGVSFALASAASTLIWSKSFGLFSAKRLFLGATALFMGASALCGGAPTITAFIVGRALAGVGGTGMYMGLLTLLSVNTSDAERPRYLSLTGFWWGIGTVLGPVVGGAFAQSAATWRWAFYLNPCIGGVVAPIYLLVLPNYQPMPGVSLRARLAKLDYVGALLSSSLFLCIMMAMNFGGVLWPWHDGRSIALFILSSVLFAAFCVQQCFCLLTSPSDRVFPMHFFRNFELVILFITMMFAAFGTFITIYYLPLYFQFTRGATALQTSVHILPYILCLSASVLINGDFMAKFGYYYPWYTFGSALQLIGGALLFTADEQTSNAKIYGYTILLGVGVGCYCQAGFPIAQMKVAASDIAYSVGFMTVSQMLGIALGTGISGAVFVNKAHQGLQHLFPNAFAEEISSAVAGVGSDLINKASKEVAAAAIHVIALAIQDAFIPVFVTGAVSFLCSLAMKKEKLFC